MIAATIQMGNLWTSRGGSAAALIVHAHLRTARRTV
eukprot:CAMPEP_0182546976 /NCGR_PEP_ID=MMETSP1323-20130603/36815_1 /TAXON_ID=236787 /ORGANISM="Florenciella parvula, Strain RCC1693" /LENGTH=35 /DNA_ID= /DNA_START= /DNA_END= /DNA_ORIENTATION=